MFTSKVKDSYDKIVLNHLVFLNSKQRQKLYDGGSVDCVGLLTQYKIIKGLYPVKHQEVVCQYQLTSTVTEVKKYIECFPSYYKFNLPSFVSEEKTISGKTYDIHDILDKKQGGKESLFFEAMYTDQERKIQGFHKMEIRDIKYFNKSLTFLKF